MEIVVQPTQRLDTVSPEAIDASRSEFVLFQCTLLMIYNRLVTSVFQYVVRNIVDSLTEG